MCRYGRSKIGSPKFEDYHDDVIVLFQRRPSGSRGNKLKPFGNYEEDKPKLADSPNPLCQRPA